MPKTDGVVWGWTCWALFDESGRIIMHDDIADGPRLFEDENIAKMIAMMGAIPLTAKPITMCLKR